MIPIVKVFRIMSAFNVILGIKSPHKKIFVSSSMTSVRPEISKLENASLALWDINFQMEHVTWNLNQV